jgi:hypothetical protein
MAKDVSEAEIRKLAKDLGISVKAARRMHGEAKLAEETKNRRRIVTP